ncbi:MAG: hypothetical protein JNM72_00430 [Deltaproteobacteria bacterium]|nr:hypothetical protein [Deltaproteobacteria bacterium]
MDQPADGPRPWALAALLLPAAGLLLLDLWQDLRQGGALLHALGEGAAVLAVGGAFAWTLQAERARSRARVAALQADLEGFRAALAARAERAERPEAPAPDPAAVAPTLVAPAPAEEGPANGAAGGATGDVVDDQLRAWRLSPAEQEVAWLLLKGVSIAEIGAARGTSPRTAQDQARAVYRKARVAGRAELAAVLLDAAAEPRG